MKKIKDFFTLLGDLIEIMFSNIESCSNVDDFDDSPHVRSARNIGRNAVTGRFKR
jgi:hypothetical protein